jgi:hypothetical protein
MELQELPQQVFGLVEGEHRGVAARDHQSVEADDTKRAYRFGVLNRRRKLWRGKTANADQIGFGVPETSRGSLIASA